MVKAKQSSAFDKSPEERRAYAQNNPGQLMNAVPFNMIKGLYFSPDRSEVSKANDPNFAMYNKIYNSKKKSK
jgi:hypothetical protein